jgi:hypothetical protein
MRDSLYQPEAKEELPTFSVPIRGQMRKPFEHIEILTKLAK